MFTRVTWFTIGAATGAVGAAVAYVRAREVARERVPESVADAAGRLVRVADDGVRVVIDRGSGAIGEILSVASETRRTRREAEDLLRRQLERSGL